MELFQRLEIILSLAKMPKSLLAKKLGVAQQTLNRYFCLEQQEKLKMHLWEIAALFPDINRDWLFFEEGKMLKAEEEADKVAEIERLKEENRKLNTRPDHDGATDEKSLPNIGKAAGQE